MTFGGVPELYPYAEGEIFFCPGKDTVSKSIFEEQGVEILGYQVSLKTRGGMLMFIYNSSA